MRTSADLWLASPSIPAAHRSHLKAVVTAVLNFAFDASQAVQQLARSRSRRRAWRDDLPWDVGLDHLAEQANPSWVPRGW